MHAQQHQDWRQRIKCSVEAECNKCVVLHVVQEIIKGGTLDMKALEASGKSENHKNCCNTPPVKFCRHLVLFCVLFRSITTEWTTLNTDSKSLFLFRLYEL